MFRFIVLVAAFIAPVYSNSAGAPSQICNNGLVPEHGLPPQSGSAPYSLSGADSVKAGELIEFTLSGDEILGFAVQVQDGNNKPIGSFKPEGLSQSLTCSGSADTLTHKKLPEPVKSVKIHWQAPQGYNGAATVQATVVKNGSTFWVGKVKKSITVA